MSRNRIPNGTAIELKSEVGTRKYVVDDFIGDGTHCLVYNAHVASSARKVRLKECFPIGHAYRDEHFSIVWYQNEKRESDLAEFRKTHNKHVKIQGDAEFTNIVSHVVDDLSEANGTLYSVIDVDEGEILGNGEINDCQSVLKLVIDLAKMINSFHQKGYLHLDIKPDNFLVLNKLQTIKSLDVDTITRLVDIQNGEIRCIPYSAGWAAPEQYQGKWKSISEKTDIFSIGAILFTLLMKRAVTTNDMSLFAEWDLGALVKETNPSFGEKIKKIFSKTIAVTPFRRYASIDEMLLDLDDALRSSKIKACIKSDRVDDLKYFAGRDNELKLIHEALQGKVKTIFVQGFGGIGKTELVKQYIHLYSDCYHPIVYRQYNETSNLKALICSIEIENAETLNESVTVKKNRDPYVQLRYLQRLVDSKTLFIIDNFDVAEDPFLDKLLESDAKFIITSRVDHSEICNDTLVQIKLDVIDTSSLLKVFANLYQFKMDVIEEKTICNIIEQYENYTILVPLIANYLRRSEIPISEFYKTVNEQGISSLDEDEIKHCKDGITSQDTLINHLRKVFPLFNLSPKHRTTLVCIRLLTMEDKIPKDKYRTYTGTNSLAVVNDLVDLGWVQIDYLFDKERIGLHPTIAELVMADLSDISEYNSPILSTVHRMASCFAESSEDKYQWYDFTHLLSVYCKIAYMDNNSAELFDKLIIILRNQFVQGYNQLMYRIEEDLDEPFFLFEDHFTWKHLLPQIASRVIQERAKRYAIGDYEAFYLDLIAINAAKAYYGENRVLSIRMIGDYLEEYSDRISDLINQCECKHNEELIALIKIGSSIVQGLEELVCTSVLNDNRARWVLSPETKFPFNLQEEAVPTLLVKLAKFSNTLFEACIKISGQEEKEYLQLQENIYAVLMYVKGKFYFPKLQDSDLKANSSFEWNDFEEENLLSELFTKEWEERIADSVWNDFVLQTQSPYQDCLTLLDYRFLSSQPVTVVKRLFKENFPAFIDRNSKISNQEKAVIFDFMTCNNIIEMQRVRKYDSYSEKNRYSLIYNFYLSCLMDEFDFYEERAGSDLFYFRLLYYRAWLILCREKHIKNDRLLQMIRSEFSEKNKEQIEDLYTLAEAVYNAGMHKEANYLREKIDMLVDKYRL